MPALALALAAALVATACDPGPAAATTASSAPVVSATAAATTTTTRFDLTLACARLGTEAVDWLEDLLDALDRVERPLGADPASWPEPVAALVDRSRRLDERAVELGCDPGTIQEGILFEAGEMVPDGRAGAFLLAVLERSRAVP